MAAVYPGNVKQFIAHKNIIDDVEAADINAIQDEVTALERTLGNTPQTTFSTVSDRITALEKNFTGPPYLGSIGGCAAIYDAHINPTLPTFAANQYGTLIWNRSGGEHPTWWDPRRNDRITVPWGGMYHITMHFETYPMPATGNIRVRLFKNNITFLGTVIVGYSAGDIVTLSAGQPWTVCAAGDFITARFQASTSWTATTTEGCQLYVVRVGNVG